MAFGKASDFAGGGFFKPADHMGDVAILVESTKIDKDVPSKYKGATRYRDEVTADITIFGTAEELEAGTPTAVLQGYKLTHGMLTGTLERNGIGNAFAGVVREIPTQNGSGYVFRDLETPHQYAVLERWFEARNAAEAAAVADAPSFG